ncbi:MAG: CinA family protein [Bdellovibrionaceae bacterium]|nr:CinA family protein [Pseudobdellovibrionaceae bacterium]
MAIIDDIVKTLEERRQTLAFAESCTGGKLSAAFVNISGVSRVFRGSVVAYSNAMKETVLDVNSATIMSLGAVSAPTALEMARGVQSISNATWTLSVTGIAGPTGGSNDKPVGTVFFAIVGPGIEQWERQRFDGDRAQVQDKAVAFAIDLLGRALNSQLQLRRDHGCK